MCVIDNEVLMKHSLYWGNSSLGVIEAVHQQLCQRMLPYMFPGSGEDLYP